MDNKMYFNKATKQMIRKITDSAVYVLDPEKLVPNKKDSDELKKLKFDDEHITADLVSDDSLDDGEILLVVNGKHYMTNIENFTQAFKDI